MITLASVEFCSGCTACKAACPKSAITMVADPEGFLRPQIDAEKCIQCHACERACPVLHPSEPDTNPTCYAARTKDDALRMASSSGGIFTELARPILAEGGVVFGCVWEKPALVAIHAKAETEAELSAMRGSKYVQSDLRDTFKEAKTALQQGRKVLFSGTPCQIAGLNRFLGKSYENLITVEVVCYGVPSPVVFEKYKGELRQCFNSQLTDIKFRDKAESWRKSFLTSTFLNGVTYREPLYQSSYTQAFFYNFCLRPSCYNCQAKCGRANSDITIADFWGIEKIHSDWDDGHGVSAVLLHTSKGCATWAMLQNVQMCTVDFTSVIAGNPFYVRSVICPKNRKFFMANISTACSIEKLVNQCIRKPLIIWLLRRFIGVLKQLIKRVILL